jgi:hypothetical protein
LRGGGGGGAGGGGGGATGLRGFATAFDGLAGLRDFAEAVRDADGRAVVDLLGRRRSVWARFFAVRAGLRAEVRDLVTRCDFAIDALTKL